MKRVLIIETSPRIHGNSHMLAEQFAEGAREAGHDVDFQRCWPMPPDLQYCF